MDIYLLLLLFRLSEKFDSIISQQDNHLIYSKKSVACMHYIHAFNAFRAKKVH